MGIVLCHKKIINLVVILILVFLLSLIIFSKYLKSFNIKRNYVIILLGIILLLLGRYLTISIENKYKLFEKSKEAGVISGRVTDFLESEYGTVVVVKNNDIYIYVYNVESTILEELKVGNQIKVYGEVRSMNVSRNPGNYNERDYLHSIKVGGKINAKSVQIVNRETYEIFVYTKKLQSFLCKQIDRIADSNKGGVLKAMLFGYRQDISEKLKEEYKMAGIFHLLSVSGVKTLKLDIPLVPEIRINWAFVPLHIAIIYILKLCLDEEIIPRCRFPCSRGYHKKYINWQKKQ